jgi:hypothetical protein
VSQALGDARAFRKGGRGGADDAAFDETLLEDGGAGALSSASDDDDDHRHGHGHGHGHDHDHEKERRFDCGKEGCSARHAYQHDHIDSDFFAKENNCENFFTAM